MRRRANFLQRRTCELLQTCSELFHRHSSAAKLLRWPVRSRSQASLSLLRRASGVRRQNASCCVALPATAHGPPRRAACATLPHTRNTFQPPFQKQSIKKVRPHKGPPLFVFAFFLLSRVSPAATRVFCTILPVSGGMDGQQRHINTTHHASPAGEGGGGGCQGRNWKIATR